MKKFGVKTNRLHLNSCGVWTDLALPLQEGDWKVFHKKNDAIKAAKTHIDVGVLYSESEIKVINLQ